MEGCPGSRMVDFRTTKTEATGQGTATVASQLRQWPIQLHLISPEAPYYQGADVVLTADCVAYALGNFHNDFLKGKSIAIGCPKLDEGQETYVDKIAAWCDDAKINTLHVVIMQVPCCRGLLQVAQQGVAKAKRKVPIKYSIVSLQGEILQEEWLTAA
jgi:hypothetical protein